MATTIAKEVMQKHRQQEAEDSDDLLADGERSLFKYGGSIGITLTSTGRDVHDLSEEMDAKVCVYADAIVIVPGGETDE